VLLAAQRRRVPGGLGRWDLDECLDRIAAKFDGAKVRSFVPLLVRRYAGDELHERPKSAWSPFFTLPAFELTSSEVDVHPSRAGRQEVVLALFGDVRMKLLNSCSYTPALRTAA
jgi:hypothetical protein